MDSTSEAFIGDFTSKSGFKLKNIHPSSESDLILITGATGFIGRNLFQEMRDVGYQVCGISKIGGMVHNTLINAVDCTNIEDLDYYCKDKSLGGIIHLAAMIPSHPSDESTRVSLIQNLKMTMNILRIFQRQSRGVFIYASSISVYGYPEKLPVTEKLLLQPYGFYPLGKLFGELLCQQYQKDYNLPIAILRISAPYGPGMHTETVITKFIKQAILSENITLYGTGKRSQDFIYCRDVVRAIVGAYKARATGIFNISSGTSTSMKELAETVLRVLPNSKSKIVYTGIDDPQEAYRAAFSFDKARKTFNYEPNYSLEKGIKEYAKVIRRELGL